MTHEGRAKRIKLTLCEHVRKSHNGSNSFALERPVHERPVLFEVPNTSEPPSARRGGDGHDVEQIARAQAPADRELNDFQQPSFTPFFL